jgi:hypothetical protein
MRIVAIAGIACCLGLVGSGIALAQPEPPPDPAERERIPTVVTDRSEEAAERRSGELASKLASTIDVSCPPPGRPVEAMIPPLQPRAYLFTGGCACFDDASAAKAWLEKSARTGTDIEFEDDMSMKEIALEPGETKQLRYYCYSKEQVEAYLRLLYRGSGTTP